MYIWATFFLQVPTNNNDLTSAKTKESLKVLTKKFKSITLASSELLTLIYYITTSDGKSLCLAN